MEMRSNHYNVASKQKLMEIKMNKSSTYVDLLRCNYA